MKLHTEISADGQDEIIIRCKERNDNIKLIEKLIANIIGGESEIKLHIGDTEYYVQKKRILFFETDDGKVTAHTASNLYYTQLRLFELEQIMPAEFVRISKSAIVNTREIASIKRDITGTGEITFRHCRKKIYFSRNYYKLLRDRIEEIRFNSLKDKKENLL